MLTSNVNSRRTPPRRRDRRDRIEILPLGRRPTVVPIVLFGQLVGLDDDAYVRGVELVVDHGAVAEEAADAKVALDQRR